MKKILFAIAFWGISACCADCFADTAPFGVASAYNLIALGYGTGNPGNIGTTADVEGRIAAANNVTQATTIGGTLGSDPYGSLANGYAMVAGVGVTASNYFSINGGGNVYAANGGGSYNFNDGGKLVKTGPVPIDFSSLRNALDTQSTQLGTLTSNGTVTLGTGSNPSWRVLFGTSSTLNVFTVTAAQFADSNHSLDIEVPAGSTVIINVIATNGQATLGAGIYFKGQQESDSNNDSGMILFNFPNTTTVTIDGQLDGAVLAPFATLTGDSQMGGNFIAAAIGQTGEVHNIEFEGALPYIPPPIGVTPEPGSLTLMGSGFLFMAGGLARSGRFRRA